MSRPDGQGCGPMLGNPLTGPGNLIKARWKIVKKIGQGAFGEIYSARNVVTSELVAIKLERADSPKQVLKLEVAVLRKLKAAECPYVVTFLACGRHHDYNYMVMELLGDNLSTLRRDQPEGKFSMLTTLKLGMQMLRAIEVVHDLGFIHRDVKPSNFAMGFTPAKRHSCYLIDFGLARRFVLPNGEPRAARNLTGFRGTARYASINSHDSKDLSRRDDLWSLLYMLIEFAKGQLPWRRIRDKDEVGEMKKKFNNTELVKDLPKEFLLMMQHLQGMCFEDTPDYALLYSLLEDMYRKFGGDENTVYDWERDKNSSPSHPRLLPSLADLCFLKVAANLETYPEIRLQSQAKQKMLKFLIRINNSKWPGNVMGRIVDSNIRELDLQECELADSDYREIMHSCTSLKSLSLGNTTDAMVKDLVAGNSALKSLSLLATRQFSKKGVKLLADSFAPKLRVLEIQQSEKLNDRSLETILKMCTRLTDLNLSGCKKVKGTAFKAFAQRKKVFHLQKLNLSSCELSKTGFRYVSKIASDLTSLSFNPLGTNYKISVNDFLALVQNCGKLTYLDLSSYHFEMDRVLVDVSRVCTGLTTLLLDGVGITDYGLQNVVQKCNKLETLRFRYGDGVSDLSLQYIATSGSSLKSITLDFWNKFNRHFVSDKGLKNLLASCSTLRELSLCNCLILNGTCFAEGGYFPYLEYLNLSDCIQLNDFAIRRITESCPGLKKLALNNLNNLTAASLESISRGCPLLEELYLRQCACFSDEAMVSLLTSMPKLFIHVTRYIDHELKGIQKEAHGSTVTDIFSSYPNTYRERAFDRTRRRMYGMDG